MGSVANPRSHRTPMPNNLTGPATMHGSHNNVVDLTGMQFGRITVVCRADNSKSRKVRWLCKCSCGVEKIIRAGSLCRGKSASCGCLRRELVVARLTRHGNSHVPEYSVWRAMLERCNNTNHVGYKNYGGRGISVCLRWQENFQFFLDDMGPRPSSELTLERNNNDGDYEPGNCRWATRSEQVLNSRPRNKTGNCPILPSKGDGGK